MVSPKPTAATQTVNLANASVVSVSGTEAFDQMIMPVTLSCGIIEFNLQFSGAADQIIKTRLSEKLGAAELSKYTSINVSVVETMIRTMNVAEASFDPRFDVEARIGLTAELTSTSGGSTRYSTTTQSVHTGEIVEESITCGLGKIQLEKSLPILLERAVDALAAEII